VAPSLRLSFFAILPAGVFFRAIDFNVRTSVVLQERRFPFFTMSLPNVVTDARPLAEWRTLRQLNLV
jgi:hypothetical protein